MSGYLLKSAEQETLATIDWSEGYLGVDEYVDADLGWSVVPAGSAQPPRIVRQAFDLTTSYARIADGDEGAVYMLAAKARTNTGRDLERSIVLRIAA
ncbi:MAG: hypothetical protein AAGB10_04515 [Pseudomonadota bacterium]